MKTAAMIDYQALIKEAAIRLGTEPQNIKMYSWYQMFPSTAGPHFGFVAGNAFTEFQILAFEDELDYSYIKYCDGVWKEWAGHIGETW